MAVGQTNEREELRVKDSGVDVGGPALQPRHTAMIPNKHVGDKITHRAPDAPTVGRTRVRGQWESLTVFKHESSPHFAVLSPEAMRLMNGAGHRAYGHKPGAAREAARAAATAKAAARAAGITIQDAAAMFGSNTFKMEGNR